MNFVPSRRSILKGMGAIGPMCVPLLRSSLAAAQAQTPGNFLYFHSPNGHVRERFTFGGPSLAPLMPHRSQVAVLTGVNCYAESSKRSHEDLVRILSCVGGDKGDLTHGQGMSIDHKLATHFGQQPLNVAPLLKRGLNWQIDLSWAKALSANPHLADPVQIFADVFKDFMPTGGGAAPGTPTNAALTARLTQKQSVLLDWIEGDIKSASARLPSGQVKQHFDRYVDSIRYLETSLSDKLKAAQSGNGPALAPASCDATTQSTLQARAKSSPPAGAAAAEQLKFTADVILDIVTTGMMCGVRRAATCLYQPGTAGINPIAKSSGDHHQVSHGEMGATTDEWAEIDAWYAQRFDELLTMLERKMILANTIVVWGTEISEGHDLESMTWLVAGGSKLGMVLGKDIDGAGKLSLSDLWVSVQQAMGIKDATFGDDSTGGIRGLYAG